MSELDCKAFYDFLFNRMPHYDELLLKDIKPFTCSFTRIGPDWWECRELVRELSEGTAYKRSRLPRIPNPFLIKTPIVPDLSSSWVTAYDKYRSNSWIPAAPGLPCPSS